MNPSGRGTNQRYCEAHASGTLLCPFCRLHVRFFEVPHSGRIVGYAMADHLRQSLVSQALEQAFQTRHPQPGLICHSDRGSQYCAGDYQQRLHQHGCQPSMSRRGNCYDNAPMESFWGTLKTELVHQNRFETRQQAILQITEYIELFYNRQRLQARLGYLSPAAFEQRFYQSQPDKI